ncbi:MAG: SulP family inorganic anion transporter [Bacteroidota bacterium]
MNSLNRWFPVQQNKYLKRIFPFLSWLPLVNAASLRADLIAGLSGAIIVLPQGVAFAIIAGMPPIYGLYTAMVTPIIAALFGSSLHLISGPTTAISIVVFAAISQFAEANTPEFISLVLTLTLMAGVIQFVLGLARLGALVNFVSHTVVLGFTAGAALLIATSQIKHILGISVPSGAPFWETLALIVQQLDQTNGYVLAVALATLSVAVLIKYLLPRWPYMIIAMLAGSVLAIWLGGESRGILTIGEMPAHLPPFRVPELSMSTIRQLAPNAFAIALLGLIEAVAIARSIAVHTKQRIDGNQEFIGQGLSNIVGSFFSCYAGSGSFTRSGVNHQSGAQTPIAAIFAAIILLFVLLFIAPYAAYLPIPAMGGIILLVAYNLIDFKHIKEILYTNKFELAILVTTFLATLFLHLEMAIYAGVILSLVFYLQRTSKPHIATMAPDQDDRRQRLIYIIRKAGLQECPQVKIIRIDGSLFFGAIDHIADFMEQIHQGEEKHLLIIAVGINFVDLAGVEWLIRESERWKQKGGGLYICGLIRIAQDVLNQGNFKEQIGADHFFFTKRAAINAIYQKVDQQICATCTKRIFKECRQPNTDFIGID